MQTPSPGLNSPSSACTLTRGDANIKWQNVASRCERGRRWGGRRWMRAARRATRLDAAVIPRHGMVSSSSSRSLRSLRRRAMRGVMQHQGTMRRAVRLATRVSTRLVMRLAVRLATGRTTARATMLATMLATRLAMGLAMGLAVRLATRLATTLAMRLVVRLAMRRHSAEPSAKPSCSDWTISRRVAGISRQSSRVAMSSA